MENSDQVAALQRLLGLGDDGVYGPGTRAAHLTENETRGLAIDTLPVPPLELDGFNTNLFAGASFPINGSGFSPNSTIEVWLYSDPLLLATVTADSGGNFHETLEVPGDTPVGDHTLEVSGESFEGEEALLSVPVTVELDVSPPVFGSASVSSSNVDVTNGAQTIDFSFTATDNSSGIRYLSFNLVGDNGWSDSIAMEGTCMGCTIAYLTSGTIQNGTWTATIEIPAGIPTQNVTVTLSDVFIDHAENAATVCDGGCPTVATFTITGPAE